jgi:hypothetical protein
LSREQAGKQDRVKGMTLKGMTTMQKIRLALLIVGMSSAVFAQTTPDQTTPGQTTPDQTAPSQSAPSSNSQSGADTAPAPAFGQNAPVLSPDNPPVTGLDEPGLDLKTASSSFISPALQISESADSNGANALGGGGVESVSRVLGALDLQQFWPKTDVFLEYLGGGEFYNDPFEAVQIEALGFDGVTRWRTGQLTLRDSFSYLPDGTFAFGYGGVPGLGIASGNLGLGQAGGGLPGLNNPNGELAPVGNIARLSNTAILDAVQAINPFSAITVAGGYGNSHFYDSSNCALSQFSCLINSDQVTVQAGYSHLLNRKDQIGIVYAFQLFQFPQATGGEVYLHIVNFRYSHNITGRLSLIAGAGPEYIDLENGGKAAHWTVSGRVTLHYKFAHSSMFASYEKYTSTGAGIFAGANVQFVGAGFIRPLGRTWQFFGDLAYSHNVQLQGLLNSAGANSYNIGSAGITLRKHLGRTLDFFTVYRFGAVGFSDSLPFDGVYGNGNIGERQIGTVGLEWHPRPTRIE